MKNTLVVLGAFVTFIGVASGVAVYNETVKPQWLKSYEKALSLESINRSGAIVLLRKALVEADLEDAPLSSKKQITQKLGDYLYANFAQSDAARMTQIGSPENLHH
ncbi:MAG: hypothetical protein P4L53_17890 [Candidatus Obscuribacterales bacterium]|nr:hypothetical protein [Candidatus Obscuribacterales bacterium]